LEINNGNQTDPISGHGQPGYSFKVKLQNQYVKGCEGKPQTKNKRNQQPAKTLSAGLRPVWNRPVSKPKASTWLFFRRCHRQNPIIQTNYQTAKTLRAQLEDAPASNPQ
jgi:hypothetical protein